MIRRHMVSVTKSATELYIPKKEKNWNKKSNKLARDFL